MSTDQMDQMGIAINVRGGVMTTAELQRERRKRGDCVTCGIKCFKKKVFKMIPITDHGRVLNGRCLRCHPLKTTDATDADGVLPAVSRTATPEELERFNRSRSQMSNSITGSQSSRSMSGSQRSTSSTSARGSSPFQDNRRSSSRHSMSTIRSQAGGGGGPTSSGETSGTDNNRSLPTRGVSSGSVMSSDSAHSSIRNSGHSSSIGRGRSEHAPLRRGVEQHPSSTSTSSPGGSGNRGQDTVIPAPPPGPRPAGGAARSQSTPRFYQDNNSRSSSSLDILDSHSAHQPSGHDMSSSSLHHYQPHELEPETAAQQREAFRRRPSQGDGGYSDFDSRHGGSSRQGSESYTDEDDYDEHAPLPSDFVPSSESVQAAMERITGFKMDEAQAEALVSQGISGLPPHLQNEYRRASQQSQRSIRSSEGGPSDDEMDSRHHPRHSQLQAPQHGMLNRGGTVSFGRMTGEHAHSTITNGTASVSSASVTHNTREGRLHSSRSLDSVSTFGGDDAVSSSRREILDGGPNPGDSGFAGNRTVSNRSTKSNSSRSSSRGSNRGEEQPNGGVGLEGLIEAGMDIDRLVLMMRDCPGSAEVQSHAMQAISDIELAPEDHAMLAEVGAVQAIVEAMYSFPDDMDLQLCGCRAMCNVSGKDVNQIAFVQQGAVPLIKTTMSAFPENPEIQEHAIATLANLAALEENLPILIQEGTVVGIVEAMNKHPNDMHVIIKGCSAVTNLASHVTPMKKDIMDAGGGGAVVLSMILHPTEAELQEKGLKALRNLSANCEENKVELANIGGIDAVISSMQLHRDIPTVQEVGAWTMCNLAASMDNKALIGDCGGIDVLIRAIWVHSEEISVLEWCCRALFSLSLDRNNSQLILEVGGISATVTAMQAHSDSSAIQEMGCAVLCNLAGDDPQAKMRIVDEEALDAIVLAMVLFGEDVRVQERACHVLLQVAISENLKSMQASNVVELVRSATTKYPQECEEPGGRLLQILEDFASDYNG